jgi:hypothetical protein
MQKEIIINKVTIPAIEEDNTIYFPVNFIGEKVLLKEYKSNQLKRNGYGIYIKQLYIDFGKDIGGVQHTNCISKEGLIETLKNCRIGRLSIDQRKAMIEVCNYLNLDIEIDLLENFICTYPEAKWRSEHDFWVQECIEPVLKELPDITWQKCNKCNKYYPYHKAFFYKDSNPGNKSELIAVCKSCNNLRFIYDDNIFLTNAYYNGGKELYELYQKNDIYNIYIMYYKNYEKMTYPDILRNSLYTINIINKFYMMNIENNINSVDQKYLINLTKIPETYISNKIVNKIIEKINKEELYKLNINNDPAKIKGRAVKRIIKKMNFNDAKIAVDTYIKNNNINIEDVYNYDYITLFKNSKVYWYVINTEKNMLGFVMKYFNNKYAAYKFKSVRGQKYWHNRDNVDMAMKYFIEKDLKLQIEKIPLYVTKNNLQIKVSTLYNILYEKRFDNSLFEWINRLYPDKFIEEDFAVGIIRNEFDSMEEKMIHDLLRLKYKNVIYNNRNNENKVTIKGMNPDWFIFTDNNIYIVEYFGISIYQNKYNKRISDYIDRAKDKIEKYKDLPYGEKIYIYPEDLKNNNFGFYEKINQIH